MFELHIYHIWLQTIDPFEEILFSTHASEAGARKEVKHIPDFYEYKEVDKNKWVLYNQEKPTKQIFIEKELVKK